MLIGLVLLVIGAVALLVNLGILSGSVWSYTWPLVLIIIGLFIIFGGHRRHWCWWHGHYPPDEDKK